MSEYHADTTRDFDKDVKKIQSDFELQKNLKNKIQKILENPHHYKPLRNILKNKRRAHVGSFVLIFKIKEDEKTVIFHAFRHHDEAYKNK